MHIEIANIHGQIYRQLQIDFSEVFISLIKIKNLDPQLFDVLIKYLPGKLYIDTQTLNEL